MFLQVLVRNPYTYIAKVNREIRVLSFDFQNAVLQVQILLRLNLFLNAQKGNRSGIRFMYHSICFIFRMIKKLNPHIQMPFHIFQ